MEDAIAKRSIYLVLRRLYRYYDGRAKSCARNSKDNPEARNSIEHIIATKTWIAKSEAIRKVAENLDITLEGQISQSDMKVETIPAPDSTTR